MADCATSLPERNRLPLQKLNALDGDIVSLVQHAGQAVQALTDADAGLHNDKSLKTTTGFTDYKERFAKAASQYFDLLATIDIRLRQHISDLQTADIIPKDSTSTPRHGEMEAKRSLVDSGVSKSIVGRGTISRRGFISGGGPETLDVGWLNSRNNHVGQKMEAELWEDALCSIKDRHPQKVAQ